MLASSTTAAHALNANRPLLLHPTSNNSRSSRCHSHNSRQTALLQKQVVVVSPPLQRSVSNTSGRGGAGAVERTTTTKAAVGGGGGAADGDDSDEDDGWDSQVTCAPAFVTVDQSNPHYSAFSIDVSQRVSLGSMRWQLFEWCAWVGGVGVWQKARLVVA